MFVYIPASMHERKGIFTMFLRSFFKGFKRSSPLNLLLINMGLLDELISGVLFIGLPLLHVQLGLTYEQIGLIFSVSAMAGIVLALR